MAEKYRILLADDHHIFRAGLADLLAKKEGWQVVGEAKTGDELLKLADSTRPDLIITDLSMPGVSGLEAIAAIKKKRRKCKILVLSMHSEKEFFRKAVQHGVDGYLLKTDVFERVLSAVQTIKEGGRSYSDEMTRGLVDEVSRIHDAEAALDILTRREREILKLVAQGYKNREIANDLGISVRTVESHRLNLMEKLDLENLQDLVKFAVSRGLA